MDAAARKRSRPESANGGAAGGKRSRESESQQTGLSSKSKPCTKFFSTVGCPFGEGCHFAHFVPGGYQTVSKSHSLGHAAVSAPSRAPADHAASGVKTRMCTKYNTAEGCKFGDKCHFAHGERELGRPPSSYMSQESSYAPPMGGRYGGRHEPPPPASMGPPAGNFGASSTCKVSVDAALAGGIIGKGGVNTKQICRITGVKLSIRDHESNPDLKNIELEGSFDQIKQANDMVRDLIASISASTPSKNPASAAAPAGRGGGGGGGGPGGRSNYKTKICENFLKGTCTFGERCHFAHGETEQRKGAAV
ncbi:Zinc finger CCCH domain-containing protein 31 [Triticum urartu]|uniref:Zinc finger CCCH domain-containing protein 31 n=1 Tax=Triticum urartu TaxID=4572 RepID=M7Z9F5_TRIUA|nr:zinc finger CCCH domain-containing protein 31-like [Triticum urartu]EMS56251.1 Zinc finger CCCH domain-containing protein 31 [Triticum urartu]